MNHLADIVKQFSQKRIVVIGDAINDQFVHGQISRVSREAPVFILSHEHTETTPGGAGNCAANLAALGAKAALVSVVGYDEPGKSLLDKLKAAGIDCRGIITTAGRKTTTKVRVLAGQAHSTRQQVIRIDYDGQPAVSEHERDQMSSLAEDKIASADALVVSDYNYGVADVMLVALALELAKQRGIPSLVDSRFRLADFGGFTSGTPNEEEIAQQYGDLSESELKVSGEALRDRLQFRALLVTRGSHGMMLFEEDKEPLRIDAVGSRQPVDVTGAGDTVIATYALGLACGASFADAARLANLAGGIVVMKRGTATVSAGELLNAIAQLTDE
ncbi:MAG: sugar kinase [Acidobacteria bacterium]|nr:MAG: sugar kinase [Acidobacteriota bacterium]